MNPIPRLIACALLLSVPALLHADAAADRKIEAAAKDSYNYRTVLDGHVKIKVSDGVVTLTGTVPDEDQRVLAENTVRNLPGVTRVDNRIQVSPGEPEYSDGWIATKVRTKLLVSNNVSAVNTKVAVKDGIVTLTGTAETVAQQELTAELVRDIAGVKSVDNRLAVVEPPAERRTVSDRVDDASITAQVKYALLTHRSTSALKTSVATTNGVVVIEGEASSGAEKDLVSHLAGSVRGVKEVQNNMVVKA